jgi:hypothetical protein
MRNFVIYTLRQVLLKYLAKITSIIRILKARMRWAGHVARMGVKRNAYRLLV